jgi:acyl-CoA thioesterase I
MAITFDSDSTFLFIGDSITDCGRRQDPEEIGNGYVRLVRDWLRAKDPATAPKVINRGISGNKAPDLKSRWDRDVLSLSPDLLSIKIGINDVWHGLGERNQGVPIGDYVGIYHEILTQVRETLPRCRLVLCEPSVIWPPQPAEGNERLQPYVRAVNELAGVFNAECVVPLHATFVRARELRPDIEWAPDGAHPSPSGHMLIARTWLAATGLM